MLLDYGTEADADGAEVPSPPPTAPSCRPTPPASRCSSRSSTSAPRRTWSALRQGYPVKGCGDVGDAQVEADEATVAFTLPAAADGRRCPGRRRPHRGRRPRGRRWLSPALIGVLALIVVLAAVAVPLYRRNRDVLSRLGPMRPQSRLTFPRNLHPGAWWLWAIGLAAAASRTQNPVPLLILAVAGLVVSARRSPPRGRSRTARSSSWPC